MESERKELFSDNQNRDKRNIKKLPGIIVIVAVIIIALTVGIRTYNSPVNQISRQLDLGYKYLENGEYEEAILAFEKAIAIDDKCMEAYVGGLEAYLNIGDEESLQAFYDRAMSAAESLDGELLAQNMGYVVEIYQMADAVYADTPQQAIEVLEKGWNVTAEPEIGNQLAEDYFSIAEERNKTGNYEDELKVYDRLLELEKVDDRVLESLGKCLIAYLESLLKDGRYDEATALIEKYREIATGVDFDKYLELVKEAIAVEEERKEEKEKEAEENNREEEGTEETEDAEDIEGTEGNTQEETGAESRQEIEESEGNGEEPIDIRNTTGTSQSGNWVDDLYQKIVAEDADAVFAIMEEPDFLERCEMYPHIEVVWSVDYRLTTSEGYVFWVLKAIDDDDLYVTCTPNSTISKYEGIYENINIAVCGEYNFSIMDGYKDWYKTEEGSDTYHA